MALGIGADDQVPGARHAREHRSAARADATAGGTRLSVRLRNARQRRRLLVDDAGRASLSPVELRLEPLDAAASAELPRALLGDGVTEQDVELVVSEATGSPFLLEQLSRDARDRGGSRGLASGRTCAGGEARHPREGPARARVLCRPPLELAVAIDAARAEPPSVPVLLSSSLIRTSIRHPGSRWFRTLVMNAYGELQRRVALLTTGRHR
jgi:hypothetical protein